MSLFGELKRRNVFRVAALYLALGWLVLQAADVLTSLLHLPTGVGVGVVVLLAFGFPVAVVIAWLFEVTPEGVVRESSLGTDSPRRQHRAQRMNLLVIAAAVVVLLVFIFDRLVPERAAPETAPATRAVKAGSPQARETTTGTAIAVLPFANLSSDTEQEFLADGITEEILNLLANVQGLRVTSRTSAFTFKGQAYDLPTIGDKLGVSYIVEGSVRKSGQKVRVTAQLIEVDRDNQIWSESYDRELDDVFAIQSEVAGEITRVLNTAMSTDELALIGTRPTESLAAWQNFMAARNAYRGRTRNNADTTALLLCDEAIQADPRFARAHSLRSVLLLDAARNSTDLSAARAEAQLALELEPLLGEPYFVLAEAALMDGRLQDAEEGFRTAISHAPNNADGRMSYSRFQLSAGYLDRSWSEARRAAELDPLSPSVFWGAAFVALVSGHLEEAAQFTRRSRENGWSGWQPDAIEGGVALQKGDFDAAEAHYLVSMPGQADNIKLAFSVIRSGHIDLTSRALLDSLYSYGPPAFARWGTEVLAGDLDAAYATAWKYLEDVAPQLGSQDGGATDAERRSLGEPIVGDWWMSSSKPFRQDARFTDLMQAAGLMDYWRSHGWPDLCEGEATGLRCR